MNKTAIEIKTESYYPDFPYLADKLYPEFKNDPNFKTSAVKNHIYDAIRNLLYQLGLDKENFNKENWKSFKNFVKEGSTVLLKPNWVRDYNPINKKSIDSLVTHSSIIKVIIDYVLKAINYKGKIIIGDAPLQSCNFENLIEKIGIKDLIELYKKMYKDVVFVIEDWRLTFMESKSIQKTKTINSEKYRVID
jgi:uncharacterized protein (DUF362 family)